MNTLLGTIAIGAFSSILLAGTAAAQEAADTAAQNPSEVTVQAKRMLTSKTVGRSPSGVPIVDVSLSYGVKASDLDLSSVAGARELERRVHTAAASACAELGRRYPNSTPSNKECAQQASTAAMVTVNRMIASAEQATRR